MALSVMGQPLLHKGGDFLNRHCGFPGHFPAAEGIPRQNPDFAFEVFQILKERCKGFRIPGGKDPVEPLEKPLPDADNAVLMLLRGVRAVGPVGDEEKGIQEPDIAGSPYRIINVGGNVEEGALQHEEAVFCRVPDFGKCIEIPEIRHDQGIFPEIMIKAVVYDRAPVNF